jgi:hypothetical protein
VSVYKEFLIIIKPFEKPGLCQGGPSGGGGREESKGRYVMKFLLVILTIRFLFSLLDSMPDEQEQEEMNNNELVIHPAEFLLR